MEKYFNITLCNDKSKTLLSYKLDDNVVTDIWSKIIMKTTPKDIRPNSTPWRGIVKDWDKKIAELEVLIDKLNEWIPNKIQSKWNINDNNESLNRLHIHFPELEKTETDLSKLRELSQYNDLIHEIQSLYNIKIRGKESMQLIICPENLNIEKVDIPVSGYKYFQHNFSFGDIFLHYCHIGRHPFEVYISNDINCPSDQIISQSAIYSYFSLKFFDIDINYDKFKNFYYNSKLSWPYPLDDPRLAFGYIKMGKLEMVNDKIHFDKQTVYNKVKNSNAILSWEIF